MAGDHLVVPAGGDHPVVPGFTTVEIRDTVDVRRAVAKAVAGHRVVAVVHEPGPGAPGVDALLDLVTAELRRVGPGVRHEPEAISERPRLSDDALEILRMLADGLTVGQAATRLSMSPRTATRRLEQAKRSLGVDTTAEAVAAILRADTSTQAPAPLVGRDASRARILRLLQSDASVVVVGEGAVGKSVLLAAVEAEAGRPAHRGGGQETLGWIDFWVVARAAGLADRHGDVEEIAARVERAVGPDLLVIDDVHLADPASVAVLCALAGRVVMLVASRPESDVVARLVEAGFIEEALEPLGAREVALLARRLNPHLTAAELDRIVAGSAGLPLLVEFLCRVDPGGVRGRGLVPAIEALSADARRAALRLALADRVLPADDQSSELVAAGVARAEDGHVRLRHALVGDALRDAAERDEIVILLSELADDAQRAGDLPAAAGYAAAAGDRARAVDLALSAAEKAGVVGDRAYLLALAARCCDDDRQEALAIEAVTALSTAGRHREVRDMVSGRTWRNPQHRGEAALAEARAHWHLGDAEAAMAAARTGQAAVEGSDSSMEAALLREIVRCDVLFRGVATTEHQGMLERAGDIAIRGGFPRAAQLSVEGIVAHFTPGATVRCVDLFAAARELAREEDDLDAYLRSTNNLISITLEAGDPVQAAGLAEQMAATAGEAGLGEWRAQALAMSANFAYHQGRYAEALAALDELDSLAVDERTHLQAGETRAAVMIDLGMLDAARVHLPDIGELPAEDWLSSSATLYLAGVHAYWSGQPRRALEIVQPLRQLPIEVADRWFVELLVAWAHYDLGEPVEVSGSEAGTPMREAMAVQARAVALLQTDPEAAVSAMDQAAALGRPWTFSLSRTAAWAAGEAARLCDRPDAAQRLLAVEQEAMEAGLEPLLARIRRSLRMAGVRRTARRTTDRSGLLTERERVVIDLLSEGATYEEVARRLGVGRSTVRRLLANAQEKLGSTGKFATVAAVRG